MRTLDTWLDLYAVSHQNPFNKSLHKICVPIITFTVFGLLWCIPKPNFMNEYLFLNWASILGALSLIFYARLSLVVFILMSFQIILILLLCSFVATNTNLLLLSITLFALAWIGQFWGHKIEGKKPSFFEDIQFLLIGPIWVVKDITGLPKTK